MSATTFIPTLKGYLALVALLANALIVPLLIPAYDGLGLGVPQGGVAVVMASMTAVICFRCFQKGRVGDRVAGALSLLFACWMFYVFVRRIF
jgi:hypothetical protein